MGSTSVTEVSQEKSVRVKRKISAGEEEKIQDKFIKASNEDSKWIKLVYDVIKDKKLASIISQRKYVEDILILVKNKFGNASKRKKFLDDNKDDQLEGLLQTNVDTTEKALVDKLISLVSEEYDRTPQFNPSVLIQYRPERFFEEDAAETMVNLRLDHRIMRSKIKENMMENYESTITKSSKIGKQLDDSSKIFEHQISEESTIYATGSRSDLVHIKGSKTSYVDIARELGKCSSGSEISKALKQIIRGEELPEIEGIDRYYMAEVAHLLFRCEPERNISALLTNAMFFELVSAGRYVIAEDLPQILPMSMIGAVDASRYTLDFLGGQYVDSTKYLTKRQFYDFKDGDLQASQSLAIRDTLIFVEWLCYIGVDTTEVNESKDKLKSISKCINHFQEVLKKDSSDQVAKSGIPQQISKSKEHLIFISKYISILFEQSGSKGDVILERLTELLDQWYNVKSSDVCCSSFSNLQLDVLNAGALSKLQENPEQKKVPYSIIPNSGGGDCAVYAVMHALYGRGYDVESQLSGMRQSICNAMQSFIPLYHYINELEKTKGVPDATKVLALYKTVFTGECGFKIFQQLGEKKILEPLEHEDEDRTQETENNLRGYASALELLSSWDDLEQEPKLVKQIFYTCNLFDIDVVAAIEDHDGLEVGCDSDLYYNYASADQIWLNNSEIAAYLLTLGYSFEGSEQYSAGTVIEFKNEEGISIFFYNNAQDLSATNPGKGMHWEACVKNSSETALEGWINSEHNNIDVGDINKYWGKLY